MILKQIPKDQLIEGRWYVGRGRNANVGLWTRMKGRLADRCVFLTIGFTFDQPTIKHEGYYDEDDGCFQPFAIVEEGKVTQPYGSKPGWDQHYAEELEL